MRSTDKRLVVLTLIGVVLTLATTTSHRGEFEAEPLDAGIATAGEPSDPVPDRATEPSPAPVTEPPVAAADEAVAVGEV